MKSSNFNWTIAAVGSVRVLFVGFQWSVRNRLCKTSCMPLQLTAKCMYLPLFDGIYQIISLVRKWHVLQSPVLQGGWCLNLDPCNHAQLPTAISHRTKPKTKPLGTTESEKHKGWQLIIHLLFTLMYFKFQITNLKIIFFLPCHTAGEPQIVCWLVWR